MMSETKIESTISSTHLNEKISETKIESVISNTNLDEKKSLSYVKLGSELQPSSLRIRYPRAIFLIMATEFCERFSFCGLRTILSLYLRNVLQYEEAVATTIYHIFIMTCYCVPIAGGLIADSGWGRFRTIFCFSVIYAIGSTLLSLSAIPIHPLHSGALTMLGLGMVATGTGGIKPCVAAFGGDQFRLPYQGVELTQYFSVFYFVINFGGLVGMIVTPTLRKTVHCFGDDSCYALGFGLPAILMVFSMILFVTGKSWYRIKKHKENMMFFVKCATFALVEKIRSTEIKAHWLDYSYGYFNPKLIEDMKKVMSILFLFIPLPWFWSMFDQQGSSWTFQASRTNNELFGFHMIPDQMQVINPAFVLVLIPVFDKWIYPCLDHFKILNSPLQRMVTGGLITGASFVASGLVEIQLQKTYPILPGKNEAHLNVINLLPCQIEVINPFNNLQEMEASKNYVFQRIDVSNKNEFAIDIITPGICGNSVFQSPWLKVKLCLQSSKVSCLILASNDGRLTAYEVSHDEPEKTLTGRPKIRIITVSERRSGISKTILEDSSGWQKIFYSDYSSPVDVSPYFEIESGIHEFQVYNHNNRVVHLEKIKLQVGAVYTFLIKESPDFIQETVLFEITQPNAVHMLWLIPQYLLMSIGEVMFAIAGLQFSFTQAPKTMKTVTIAAWYLSVAMGNLIVIVITNLRLFECKAHEFFLYAGFMFIDMVIFSYMTKGYTLAPIENDDSQLSLESKELLESK